MSLRPPEYKKFPTHVQKLYANLPFLDDQCAHPAMLISTGAAVAVAKSHKELLPFHSTNLKHPHLLSPFARPSFSLQMASTSKQLSLEEIRTMEKELKTRNQLRRFPQRAERDDTEEKLEEKWGEMAQPAGETISLEEVKTVANRLKQRRLVWGLTQGQLGELICLKYGARLSQTTVSRFEMMDCTVATARRLFKPMKEMMELIHEVFEKNGDTPTDRLCEMVRDSMGGTLPAVRERKRRVTYTDDQLNALDALFQQCDSPTSAQLTRFAAALGLDFSEVRVWFCNRRQKRRKTGKRDNNGDESTEDILSRLENKNPNLSTVRELIQDKQTPDSCKLIESLDRMPKEEIVINVSQKTD